MTRQKRKASGFDQSHEFWAKALDMWQRGYSNAQVAAQAQADGYDLKEDQVRYARNRYWTADELELAQMKVLLDSYARQGRLLNETNDTITVLQAKLGRLMPEAEPLVSEDIVPASIAEAEQWQG